MPMAKYKVIGMLRSGLEKEIGDSLFGGLPAPYLLQQQRAVHLVTVATGLLQQQGNLLDTGAAINPVGAYIYVMDGDGRIYAAPSTVVQHHSAFLAGNPVAAAGEITVAHGRLTDVDDRSGHYMPPIDYSKQFLKELKSRGVAVDGIQVNYHGTKKKVLKALGQTRERLYPTGPKLKAY
jgi:hypothetical protein